MKDTFGNPIEVGSILIDRSGPVVVTALKTTPKGPYLLGMFCRHWLHPDSEFRWSPTRILTPDMYAPLHPDHVPQDVRELAASVRESARTPDPTYDPADV
jgi:hypothetical protein